jgi:hypothetical protein
MSDLLKTPAPAPEKHLTRTGIMLAILPSVTAALAAVPGLKLTEVDPVRRAFRAIVTIGIRLALDAGLHPQTIMSECGVAIGAELKERSDVAKEQGATMPSPSLPQ